MTVRTGPGAPGIGTVHVKVGQTWRVRDGFESAEMEVYVVSLDVKRGKARVHTRRNQEHWLVPTFEERTLPLDGRWGHALELLP